MDASSLDEDVLQAITIRRWSMMASLAMVLYEYIITFNEEMKHIWRTPLRPVRLIYIFSRYFAIIVGSINIFLMFGPLSSTDIPRLRCKKWFIFQTWAMCSIMGALDAILMLRVYALHNKDRRVGTFLGLLFLCQVIVEAVCGMLSVDVPYSGICNAHGIHPAVMYYGASVWITHISLAALTAWKYDLMKLNIPIVKTVTRDGAWITVLIFSMYTTLVPLAFVKKVQKAHILFGWPISIMSIACCRMIMNMQKLDITGTESTDDSENLTELTSELLTLQVELKG